MTFQSEGALGEEFSHAFNRQMNSKRQASFRDIAIATAQFPLSVFERLAAAYMEFSILFLVEFISDSLLLGSDSLKNRKICFTSDTGICCRVRELLLTVKRINSRIMDAGRIG